MFFTLYQEQSSSNNSDLQLKGNNKNEEMYICVSQDKNEIFSIQ